MAIKAKLVAAASVSPGSIVHLTYAQAEARRHKIEPVDKVHASAKDPAVLPFRALGMLSFKAGEELAVEGTIDRSLQNALGQSDDQVEAGKGKGDKADKAGKASKAALDKAFEGGRTEGLKSLAEEVTKARAAARAELLAEIAARNDLVDALEAAQAALEDLGSDATDEQRAAAQKAVDDAQAAVDALQPLEA